MGRRGGLLLCLLLACLCLAACGEKGEKGRETARRVDWQTAPAYLPEDVALPVETCALNGSCTDGESIYYLTETRTEGERGFQLFRASLAEGTAEPLPQYRPPAIPEGAGYLCQGPVLGPDGTLWVYEAWSVYHYDLPPDFDGEQETKGKYFAGQDDFHQLRQLDIADGRELAAVDFSETVRGAMGKKNNYEAAAFAVDSAGRIYLGDKGGISVLDKGGELLFTQEATLPYAGVMGSGGSSLALLPDGAAAALTVQPGGKREVRTLDPAAKGWGERRWEVPGEVVQIYPGSRGFLFFCQQKESLLAWEPEEPEGRELLKLSAGRVDSGLMCFAPLEEGRLAALTLTYGGSAGQGGDTDMYSGSLRLRILSPTDKAPEDEKVKLVYGTLGLTSADRSRINQFNQSSEEYYIEVRDYGEGVQLWELSQEQEAAAKRRLFADVAAGNIPDIWDSTLPLRQYARKGAFEDLWPWIESDPELGREAVMEHVLECASLDGALYSVCSAFLIKTVIACSDVVGDRTSWTLEELLAAYETLEPGASIFSGYTSSRGLLTMLIDEDLDRYVDWDAGTCNFDTEAFKSLLELCARVPREEDYTFRDGASLRERQTLVQEIELMAPSQLLFSEALCAGPEELTDYEAYLNANHIYATIVDESGNWREKEAVPCRALSLLKYNRASKTEYHDWTNAVAGALEEGGYVSYVGYPTQGGAGSSFRVYDELSMSASSQHKEGAWAYIRQVLLPDGSQRREAGSSGAFTYSPGFPVNRSDFDKAMSPKWVTDKSGAYVLDGDGQKIEEPGDHMIPLGDPATMLVFDLAPKEAQLENFWKLYNAIDHVEPDERDLYVLIQETAEAYFAGDKSVDETAALIQSRAAIYVGEQQ